MFRFLVFVVFAVSSVQLAMGQESQPKVDEPTGKSLTDKYSYLLGYNFIQDFKSLEVEINLENVIQGMKDSATDKDSKLTLEEIQAVEIAFQKLLTAKRQELFKRAADKNLRDGAEFMKKNALETGVKEFESGLQVKVNEEGDGDLPKLNDRVKVFYKGTFLDGKQFDGTLNTPATFGVGGVIRGMSEALQKMKVGSKWTIYVPGNLAYGLQGYPEANIGPNQSLIFELELVEIIK